MARNIELRVALWRHQWSYRAGYPKQLNNDENAWDAVVEEV